MKIIAIKTLRDFWTANPDAEQPLKAWVDEASKAEWKTPAEFKEQYRSALRDPLIFRDSNNSKCAAI